MRLLPSTVVILGLFVSSAAAEVIVDARPDTAGGLWLMTPGSERDVLLYLSVGNVGDAFTSNGAQLAVSITGAASPLPQISTIDFSGTDYVFQGNSQKSFVAIDPSAGYRDCWVGGSNNAVDTNRRVMALVHVTAAAGVPAGDYVLNPNPDFGPSSNYWTEISGAVSLTAYSGTIRVVPEPMSWVQLLGLGAIGLPIVLWCRRRGHRALS